MIHSGEIGNMTILVMSCDKNDDLFPLYHHCIEKYWPDHPEVVYCMENVINPYYKTICCGNLNWGLRLKKCLEQIEDKTILLTLDDIFIREPVNIELINKLNNIITTNKNIGFINFEGEYRNDAKDATPYTDYCNVFNTKKEYYKISVMLNLFNKDCLLTLCNDISAWDFEKQITSYDWIYLITKNQIINFGKNKETCCNWGLVGGKWTRELINFFNKENIKVDYGKREIK